MSVWGNKVQKKKKTRGKEDLVVAVICWSERNQMFTLFSFNDRLN